MQLIPKVILKHLFGLINISIKYNYDLYLSVDQLQNQTYKLKIPYIQDLAIEGDPKNNHFYNIELTMPSYDLDLPILLQKLGDVYYPETFAQKVVGNYVFDNMAVPLTTHIQDVSKIDSNPIIIDHQIWLSNKSYFDWKSDKIKLGTNPDGPTFNGIALPPDSGTHQGFLYFTTEIKNKIFDININVTNPIKVKHSIIDGPNPMYYIKATTGHLMPQYQDKFFFFLKDLNTILSAPLNEETIWKYKEKV